MNLRRRLMCLLFTASATAMAQTPPANPPELPPGPLPPTTVPEMATGAQFNAGQLFPHSGNLPNAPTSAASQRNTQLPTVTFREFRSSICEVTPRGATDMFISALVKTRKFRVLERARIAEGIAMEKGFNQQGMSTGQAGQSQYLAATYMFEATISEASAGDQRSSFSLGAAGAAAGRAWSTDTIAIDVRVIDVESGIVVEAVNARKEIKGVETKAGGFTSALANLVTRGRGSAVADVLAPSDSYASARKDSVDKALREAIETAVNEITKRLSAEP